MITVPYTYTLVYIVCMICFVLRIFFWHTQGVSGVPGVVGKPPYPARYGIPDLTSGVEQGLNGLCYRNEQVQWPRGNRG